MNPTPEWLQEHRRTRNYHPNWAPSFTPGRMESPEDVPVSLLLSDQSFNNHFRNDGSHVSPYDTGIVEVGTDGLQVQLLQGIDHDRFKQVLARATRATTGLTAPVPTPASAENRYGLLSPDIAISDEDWQEMMNGGLQAALESQTVVFEVWGASRALTHQLVRSRRAGFHQQSQRATFYGDRPEVRMPESIWRSSKYVRQAWLHAVEASWDAYRIACNSGVSYQDARYILPEGTVNYIQCEYTVREFLAVYAYRGCSMFLWEMVACMRMMREALLAQSPWLERWLKVSCETGPGCPGCKGSGYLFVDGTPMDESEVAEHKHREAHSDEIFVCGLCQGTGGRKCTFQGWENVEGQCDKPQARQSNRVFLPNPKFQIG